MERKSILRNPAYWITLIQLALYECALEFMRKTGKNRKQLAEHLGVSKGYVTQILNGDYDHKLSTFIELSLSFGYVPKIDFIPIDEYKDNDNVWVKASDVTSETNSGAEAYTTATSISKYLKIA